MHCAQLCLYGGEAGKANPPMYGGPETGDCTKKAHLYLLQEYFLKLLTYRFLSGKISFQVITFLSWDIYFLYLLINLLFL